MTSDFSRTLALLRREKKISQRIAASDLKISQALLSHYENGLREPGLSFVVRAADYYGVSCDYMLGRSMAKDGSAMPQEKIPDVSEQKANVLKGSVIAMLQKKLIVNSAALIMDLAGKTGSRQFISEISNYISLSIYRVFRYMYMSDDKNPPENFKINEEYFEGLCDAEMRMCELRIKNTVNGDGMFQTKDDELQMPNVMPNALAENYPGVSQSLLTLLQTVSDNLTKRCEQDKK